MGILSSISDDYEQQLWIQATKIRYLEGILNNLNVAIAHNYPQKLEYVWVGEDEPIVSDVGAYRDEFYSALLGDDYDVDRLYYKLDKTKFSTSLYMNYNLVEHTLTLHKYNTPPKSIIVVREKQANGSSYTIVG
jgi:hypothetical protein